MINYWYTMIMFLCMSRKGKCATRKNDQATEEGTRNQRKKFEVYGSKAQGQKRADHALSICLGEDGKVMHDNLNVEKKFSVETLALYMEDVCYCYIFDINEDVK